MANKEAKKQEVIKEKPGKDGWTRSEEIVLKNANTMFDLLVSILKKIEVVEYDANEIYLLHNPDEKDCNPGERIDRLLNKYLKHINGKYMAYLKKNKIKLPKNIQAKTCVLTPLKQVRTIK